MSEQITYPAPVMNGAPDCDTPDECRFVQDGQVAMPLEAWTPVYNRQGMVVNARTIVMPMKCQTCDKTFERRVG